MHGSSRWYCLKTFKKRKPFTSQDRNSTYNENYKNQKVTLPDYLTLKQCFISISAWFIKVIEVALALNHFLFNKSDNQTKGKRINEKGYHNLRRWQEPRKQLIWRALQHVFRHELLLESTSSKMFAGILDTFLTTMKVSDWAQTEFNSLNISVMTNLIMNSQWIN